MISPWDEFSVDDRRQLLQLSKDILSDQMTIVEGVCGLWNIALNYNFESSEDLLWLKGVVDEFSYSERGEPHLYSPEMLERKNRDRKCSMESYGPHVREIASRIIGEIELS